MDIKDYIKKQLEIADPQLDIRDNSPYSDLFIAPQAYLGQIFYSTLSILQQAMGAAGDATDFTPTEIQILAKKAFIEAVPARRSYGTIILYLGEPRDIDLTGIYFTTKAGGKVYISSPKYIGSSELVSTDYGYKAVIVAYSDSLDVPANSVIDCSLEGWTRIENTEFTGGSAGTTPQELLDLYYNSYIFQDNFLYARSIINLIKGKYPDIKSVFIAGKGDPEMQRDLVVGLDALNGIPGVITMVPHDKNFSLSISPAAVVTDGGTYNPDDYVLTPTTRELDNISSPDSSSVSFTPGQLTRLEYLTFKEAVGNEYSTMHSEWDGNATTGMAVLSVADTEPDMAKKQSSKTLYAETPIVGVSQNYNNKVLSATFSIEKLSGRYLYVGFAPKATEAQPAKYYKMIGIALKPSTDPNEDNVFLTRQMDVDFGKIVVGETTLNIGDNWGKAGDSSNPPYTFGRPYLAATHIDIETPTDGNPVDIYCTLTLEWNPDGKQYTITGKINATDLTYTEYSILDSLAEYSAIQYGVADDPDGNPYKIILQDAEIQTTPPSGACISMQSTISFPHIPDTPNDFYKKLTIELELPAATFPSSVAPLVPDVYIVKPDADTSELKYVKLNGAWGNGSSSGSGNTVHSIFTYEDTEDLLYASIMGLNTNSLKLVLAYNTVSGNSSPCWPSLTLYFYNIVLNKVGAHLGNTLDVYVTPTPVLKVDSNIPISNGIISLSGNSGYPLSGGPILKIVNATIGDVTSEATLVPISGETEEPIFYRYSTLEKEHYNIKVASGGNGYAKLTYYTDAYVALIQDMAKDPYYRDPLQDVLIKSYIPIELSALVFSVNVGYTQINADTEIQNYILANPTLLDTHALEQIVIQDGARSASILRVGYIIHYPEYDETQNITIIPAILDARKIPTNYPYPVYKRNKAFVYFKDSFNIQYIQE